MTLLKENVKNVKEETRKEVEKMRVHVRLILIIGAKERVCI